MAITLVVMLTVFFVEYFPNIPTFFKKKIEEHKVQDMTVKRSLQIIRSLDDVFANKAEKVKSIVIDNGKKNQMWLYLSKEKSNILPKSSGMLNTQMSETLNGMSNSQTLDDDDDDENLATEDVSLNSESSEDIELSEKEKREYLFDAT